MRTSSNSDKKQMAEEVRKMALALFSASAAISVLSDDDVGELELPELRHRIIFNPDRRNAFIAGRVAARSVIKQLGLTPEPIAAESNGAPNWPEGISGSISHSAGLSIAVADRSEHSQAVGVDLQEIRTTKPGLVDRIASAEEVASLKISGHMDAHIIPLVAFSAKEAVFKSLSIVQQQNLTIADIQIGVPGFGRFTVEKIADQTFNRDAMIGRFTYGNGFVLAGLTLLENGARAA